MTSIDTDSGKANLARLCHRLIDLVSADQLRQIGSVLQLPDEIIAEISQPLTMLMVVRYVAEIDKAGKLTDFLDACAQKGFELRADTFPPPNDRWTPRPLPRQIIEMLNEKVGLNGSRYLTYQLVSHRSKPEYQDTGCFHWPLRFTSHVSTPTYAEQFAEELYQIRGWLAAEVAFAYISAVKAWGKGRLIPCVVVIPSRDQFDSIRIEQTTGGNENLYVDNLIEELESADRKFGLDIIEVDDQIVTFRTKRKVETAYNELCAWLKEFSPLGLEELKVYESRFPDVDTWIVRLWWD